MDAMELRRAVGREVQVAMIRAGYPAGGAGIRRLAAELGMPRETLRDKVSGKRELGQAELYRIALILGVHIADLYPPADTVA
jgi:Helix-turn-helix